MAKKKKKKEKKAATTPSPTKKEELFHFKIGERGEAAEISTKVLREDKRSRRVHFAVNEDTLTKFPNIFLHCGDWAVGEEMHHLIIRIDMKKIYPLLLKAVKNKTGGSICCGGVMMLQTGRIL